MCSKYKREHAHTHMYIRNMYICTAQVDADLAAKSKDLLAHYVDGNIPSALAASQNTTLGMKQDTLNESFAKGHLLERPVGEPLAVEPGRGKVMTVVPKNHSVPIRQHMVNIFGSALAAETPPEKVAEEEPGLPQEALDAQAAEVPPEEESNMQIELDEHFEKKGIDVTWSPRSDQSKWDELARLMASVEDKESVLHEEAQERAEVRRNEGEELPQPQVVPDQNKVEEGAELSEVERPPAPEPPAHVEEQPLAGSPVEVRKSEDDEPQKHQVELESGLRKVQEQTCQDDAKATPVPEDPCTPVLESPAQVEQLPPTIVKIEDDEPTPVPEPSALVVKIEDDEARELWVKSGPSKVGGGPKGADVESQPRTQKRAAEPMELPRPKLHRFVRTSLQRKRLRKLFDDELCVLTAATAGHEEIVPVASEVVPTTATDTNAVVKCMCLNERKWLWLKQQVGSGTLLRPYAIKKLPQTFHILVSVNKGCSYTYVGYIKVSGSERVKSIRRLNQSCNTLDERERFAWVKRLQNGGKINAWEVTECTQTEPISLKFTSTRFRNRHFECSLQDLMGGIAVEVPEPSLFRTGDHFLNLLPEEFTDVLRLNCKSLDKKCLRVGTACSGSDIGIIALRGLLHSINAKFKAVLFDAVCLIGRCAAHVLS